MIKILVNFLYCFSFFFLSCKSGGSKNHRPVIINLPQKSRTDTPLKNNENTYRYNLKNPNHTWRLPEQLAEVSGNTWIDTNHLMLIEDIHADLYYIKIDEATATLERTIPFADNDKDKFDIEDVTYVNHIVYALWSHGDLFKITNWQTNPGIEKIKTGLHKENNTEGLCYDPVSGQLLVACKGESNLNDEKKSTRAVYQFDMAQNKLKDQPFLLIHKKDFEKLADEKLEFNPSAIAVHPITHDIYLLSTRDNKCMAVYSRDGMLKAFQYIDPELMPQPEGICFSPDGKLYISSEGKKGEPGNLFEFNPSK
ncbi:MAG: SdiA-regulated domain-containing protein [Ginsengibacter sp.]